MNTRPTPRQTARLSALLLALLLFASPALAQGASTNADAPADPADTKREKLEQLNQTTTNIDQRLKDSLAELDALRQSITAEKLPIDAELRKLEEEYARVRTAYDDVSKQVARRAIDEQKVRDDIKAREASAVFIANRLDEYIREFEAAIEVSENQAKVQTDAGEKSFEQVLQDYKDMKTDRPAGERFGVQSRVVRASLDRLDNLLGGMSYRGSALDAEGVIGKTSEFRPGTFVQFGPVVVFSDDTGRLQGTVPKVGNSLDALVLPFHDEADGAAVKQLAQTGKGTLPLDASPGGEARSTEKVEAQTLEEEIAAGGPVMYPIIGLAVATVLIGLYKFLAISLTPPPSSRKLAALLQAVSERSKAKAQSIAKTMRGPTGRMLQAGAEHLDEPRDLIEEVMYEKVLTAKLKVQRLLPFVAICAAAAPLLGLLGTVSGIINTFQSMQASGGADMQNVSGGISEALITTKFGLIVAIPALLLHVFLSRMARGVIDKMEKSGVAFINQVMKTPPAENDRLSKLNKPSPDGDTPPKEPRPDKQSGKPDKQSAKPVKQAKPSKPLDEMEDTAILPAEELEDEPALVQSGLVQGGQRDAQYKGDKQH